MKNVKSFIILMIIMLMFSIPAYAHKMSIEPVEDGIVKVLYDDGSFSSRTEVTVYDSNDQIIENGKLDEDGQYTYDTSGDPSYIVADDGMGHKDEWKIGEEVAGSSGGSKALKIVAVVLVLGAVAGGASYKKKKKN